MVLKGVRGRICHSVYWYAKDNNKYVKDYDKNIESYYLKCWDVNSFYGWAMSHKLLVNNFVCMKQTSQFNEDFLKNYNKKRDKGYFFEDMFNILQNYMNFIMI